VSLMNPRNWKQKVAAGVVNGLGGNDKFNFNTIPNSWFKVDVNEAMYPNATLMYPEEAGN
jgi:hypothetical protein